MFTVTVWESDWKTGAYVAGREKFDAIGEATHYFTSYVDEKNLHISLERTTTEGREVTLAEIDQEGILYHRQNGEWVIDKPDAFRDMSRNGDCQ